MAEPAPAGFLIIGANPVARALGKALNQLGSRVLLTDSSWENIRAARMDGLPTYFGNPTSQHADAHLDLVGLGHLLALSPSSEMNALACMRFRHDFAEPRRFTLPSGADSRRSDKHRSSEQVRGRELGLPALTYPQFASRLGRGAEIRITTLTEAFDWPAYQAFHGNRATLLLARDTRGWVHIAGPSQALEPQPGWSLVALVDADTVSDAES